MEAEPASETSVAKDTFTWLIAREDYVVYCRLESFKSCLDHVLVYLFITYLLTELSPS
jgi:hypothetical protein